jgi:hypothetical protein
MYKGVVTEFDMDSYLFEFREQCTESGQVNLISRHGKRLCHRTAAIDASVAGIGVGFGLM